MPEQAIPQNKQSQENNDERPMRGLLAEAPVRAILVSIDTPETDWPIDESLDELRITRQDRLVGDRFWRRERDQSRRAAHIR